MAQPANDVCDVAIYASASEAEVRSGGGSSGAASQRVDGAGDGCAGSGGAVECAGVRVAVLHALRAGFVGMACGGALFGGGGGPRVWERAGRIPLCDDR